MTESGEPGSSRYLKRKLNLGEADLILEGFVKSRNQERNQNPGTVTEPPAPGAFDDVAACTNYGDAYETAYECQGADDLLMDQAQNDELCSYESQPVDVASRLENESTPQINMLSFEDCPKSIYLPLLCVAFKIKYNLSSAAFEDHLRIVQIATESTIEELRSAAKCTKKYDGLNQKVEKIFVCMDPACSAILSTGSDGLPTKNQGCGHLFTRNQGSCYVLTLPIEQQLQYYLENGGMHEGSGRAYDENMRGDIQSGSRYRDSIKSPNPAGEPHSVTTISVQLNVDGAQCFKTSKFGFWPFMAVINEAPYRSRRSNMILLSLWFGNKKPPAQPFLGAGIKELQRLGTEGMMFSDRKFIVKPTVLTTDTMARPVFLNCIQFNGKFGCNFCLHPGEQIKKGKGSTRIYPEPDNADDHPGRTFEQHTNDLKISLCTGKSVHGINGPSPLEEIDDYDYVTAQVPDYLHSVCQGVAKFLIGLWTETKHCKQPWYLNAEKKAILTDRLLKVRPPYEVTRTPDSILDTSFWSATDFKSFVLYYFPTLDGLLPKEHYEHFLYFSYGLHVLLQEEVHLDRVKETKILFKHFVQQAEILYGRENMRFNMHLLTHLADSVIDWGCLWASSTFIPEWFNGQLQSMTNGTQFVAEQMVRSFLLRNVVRSEAIEIISKYLLPENVSSLLCELLHIPTHLCDLISSRDNFYITPNQIKLFGRPIKRKTSLSIEIAVRNYLKNVSFESDTIAIHDSYHRFLLPRINSIFTTTSYTRSPKRINDCAFMKDGSFFIIQAIILFDCLPLNNQPFVVGRTMGTISSVKCNPPPIDDIDFSNLPGQSTKLLGLSKSLIAYSADSIFKKCVLLPQSDSFNAHSYIVTAIPNSVETD